MRWFAKVFGTGSTGPTGPFVDNGPPIGGDLVERDTGLIGALRLLPVGRVIPPGLSVRVLGNVPPLVLCFNKPDGTGDGEPSDDGGAVPVLLVLGAVGKVVLGPGLRAACIAGFTFGGAGVGGWDVNLGDCIGPLPGNVTRERFVNGGITGEFTGVFDNLGDSKGGGVTGGAEGDCFSCTG
ncbi:hypothetical protein OIE52_40560 [Streptomyces canus]|uniref:hypothetical protein n=1 Tax=Streptomyces canus TaxID=58343 RepID=UPI00324FED51